MKQFVTSSFTLTFTGCWPSVSKELCLELMLGDGRAEIDFLQLIQNVYSQQDKWAIEKAENTSQTYWSTDVIPGFKFLIVDRSFSLGLWYRDKK